MTDKEKHDEARLTVPETLSYLRKKYSVEVSRNELQRWMDVGRLPFCQPFGPGGRVLFRRADVDALFAVSVADVIVGC